MVRGSSDVPLIATKLTLQVNGTPPTGGSLPWESCCNMSASMSSLLRVSWSNLGTPRSAWRTRLLVVGSKSARSHHHYDATVSDPRQKFITWLEVVLWIVLGYSLLLVFAGATAGSLFAWLGFGPADSIDSSEVRDYLRLPYMVLGAVMAGWSALMIQIARGPLKEGSSWAWTVLVRSLSLWFVLDTAMSVVLGHPMHAIFNIPFAVALGLPLFRLRPGG